MKYILIKTYELPSREEFLEMEEYDNGISIEEVQEMFDYDYNERQMEQLCFKFDAVSILEE